MPEGLSDRLQDLKSHYCSQLPDRIKEIDRSLNELSSESWRDALERLRLQAHKIAGSGAIFGFDTVSSVGRKLENAVVEILQTDSGIDSEHRSHIAKLTSELESECTKATRGHTGGRDAERKERQIALVAPDRSADLDDLSEQLSYFGYDVAFVSTFEALRIFAESSPNGLAIVHTDFVTGAFVWLSVHVGVWLVRLRLRL